MIDRIFLDHPRSVNESYAHHARFAFGFAMQLLCAGAAALIHALVPCLFEKTASRIVLSLSDRLKTR